MSYYDKGTLRIIGFASLIIVFSMLLIGGIVYGFTEAGVVRKLKEKDLPHLVQGMSSKIDGLIARAKETSLVLAEDPDVIQWLAEGEPPGPAQERALQRLTSLVQSFGYSNSFIVSTQTHHYWGENGKLLGTVSEGEKADQWFFGMLKSGDRIQVVLDYNKERKDTFIFVDALSKYQGRPVALVGVGMNLKDLSAEFQQFKYGSSSHLWLVNPDGTIVMSDRLEDNGKPISTFLSTETLAALGTSEKEKAEVRTIETHNANGELADLISHPLSSTNMRLLFQIDRKETVSFLSKIKFNTIAISLISFVLILVIFYYVSHRLANPLERSLRLNEQLERKVKERTQELAEHNAKLMDSIDYAKRIQESMLPHSAEWSQAAGDHVLIYKPRDGVGGDFHWVKPLPGGTLIAIGDCTGHGVPGALMTMLSLSLLDRIADQPQADEPAHVLSELNRLIKVTLHQTEPHGLSDDGLDIGICFISSDRKLLRYAGAKCSLYLKDSTGIRVLEGQRKSIGYRRTPLEFSFSTHQVDLLMGTSCYLATDGFFDQNGGSKGYPFGKRRFADLLDQYPNASLQEQTHLFWNEFEKYKGDEAQRDDITLLAFQAS